MGQKLRAMVTALSALFMLTATIPAAFADEGNACQIIRHEVEQYYADGGACPCPYHAANDGHLCGGRSAWAKRQGASPRCFTSESDTAPRPVIAITAHHTRWPDPPACGTDAVGTQSTPPRTAETRPSDFPSFE